MNSKKVVINAYKGLFVNFLLDLRKTAFIAFLIICTIVFVDFVMSIIFVSVNQDIFRVFGPFFIGGFVMMFAFTIHVIMSTSPDEMYGKFTFPINRSVYGITNFVFLIIGSFILLAIVTIVAPIEMFLYQILELSTHKILYLNEVTLNSFIIGFTATWAYLFCFGSLTYGIFMYIRNYTLYSLLTLTIVISIVVMFGWLGDVTSFIFLEHNLLILIIKLISIAIISNILGFIPLKRLEVK